MSINSTSAPKWKDVPLLLRLIWIVSLVNFLSFWIIAAANGGDAMNGIKDGGKYFLGSHRHYTEVSKAFFDYSRIHTISIWITLPVALIGGFWFFLRRKEALR